MSEIKCYRCYSKNVIIREGMEDDHKYLYVKCLDCISEEKILLHDSIRLECETNVCF
jgi:ribosomal protein S27E